MKQRVADYFADYLVEHGIDTDFTIPGGGAMYLDDAFAHKKGMKCVFVQHEQAAAIAAEAYARLHKTIPFVCCTTGPGGTNTLTGVLGAWLDSIPMLIISGQVRYATTARSTGLPLRAMGDQEFDITKVVDAMTKYAVMLNDPKMAMYHLEKALYLAQHGRPGPVWIDVPLDVQWALMEPDDFIHFDPIKEGLEKTYDPSDATIDKVIEMIRQAKRPTFNAGNGIRIANAFNEFNKAIKLLNMPVVTGWDSIDLIADDNPLYVGRAGIMGDRPGNWAIQNSDLVLSVGSRLGVRQVGYSKKNWARAAQVIMVDIDEYELIKPSIHVEFPIQADAKLFLEKLITRLNNKQPRKWDAWNETCLSWKKNYPVVLPKHYEQKDEANVYCFIKELSRRLPEGKVTVVGNGSACVVGSHAYVIKEGQRFIINSGAASMGYDLPAAIGASFATNKGEVILVTGDGSLQMNIQELQTIVYHKLPIKIFVINNDGYHSMRQTESNLFKGHTKFGVGPDDSMDLSFPSLEKIAYAYGFPYYAIHDNSEMNTLDSLLAQPGYLFCEIFVDTKQFFEPKSATKQLPNGTLVSPPLEDLAPFLPREELKKIMLIPLLDEKNE